MRPNGTKTEVFKIIATWTGITEMCHYRPAVRFTSALFKSSELGPIGFPSLPLPGIPWTIHILSFIFPIDIYGESDYPRVPTGPSHRAVWHAG